MLHSIWARYTKAGTVGKAAARALSVARGNLADLSSTRRHGQAGASLLIRFSLLISLSLSLSLSLRDGRTRLGVAAASGRGGAPAAEAPGTESEREGGRR